MKYEVVLVNDEDRGEPYVISSGSLKCCAGYLRTLNAQDHSRHVNYFIRERVKRNENQ